MLARGIEVAVVLYMLVILGSSLEVQQLLPQNGAPACPNSSVTLTCISKSASLTWNTTCNDSLRSVSYVEGFPVQKNLKLCNNEEAFPTVVVHNDTTIEMILTLMAFSSLNGTTLECYSEVAGNNLDSKAWATILVLDQPQAPVGVVFHSSNLTLQWQQTAHLCDYTIVSTMGGANKNFTVDCNVTMKVFDGKDLPLTTNLTFEVRAVNCAGRSAPGFTSYQFTPTCTPSPFTPSGECACVCELILDSM